MTILALEFSSHRRSVALARHGIVLAEFAEQTLERGTNAFGLIEKTLAEAKISREEIEAVAVGLGPGSYTGIRAAIAIAQGWQLARDVKVIGVSSASAIAAQAQHEGVFGRINIAIDAQRGEFYQSLWEVTQTRLQECAALKIASNADIVSLLAAGKMCLGPEQNVRIYPTAARVAEMANGQINFVSADKLEPIYLREANFVKATPTRKSPA